MRIATFNIHHGLGADGVLDIARVGRVLAELDATAIALQELDVGWARSGHVDQPAELGRASGLHVAFRPTVTRSDGAAYGIALATREPAEAIAVDLPRLGDEEPRALQSVVLDGVTIVTTHLSRDATARRSQIDFLAGFVARVGGPVVLAGDLNTGRGALAPLFDAGLSPFPKRVRTVPPRFPRAEIDHILVGGGLELAGLHSVRTMVSDHRPLVADLKGFT